MRKKRKVSFEVSDSHFVLCGNVSTGKIDFPQENNIAYILWSNIGRNFACFQSVITYFKIPNLLSKSLLVIRPKDFQILNLLSFFWIIWNYCFYRLFHYWLSFSILCKMFLFTLFWKNHLGLSHSVCLFLYYLVHFENP